VAGDSAGGNLAAAVCLQARERGERLPAVQLLIYPALNPRLETDSAREFAEGYGLTTEDMRWSWRQYAPDESRRQNPLVAPAQASSLRGLPPAIVVTAGFDILRDEGRAYAERLTDAGVRTVPLHYEDSIHGFLWMAGRLEATTRMLGDVRDGLRRLW
jgi:acetyl esterase